MRKAGQAGIRELYVRIRVGRGWTAKCDGPTVDVASFWDSNDAEASNNADVQVAVFKDTGYVANFTLPTLKIFLEARSQNVYVNQQ